MPRTTIAIVTLTLSSLLGVGSLLAQEVAAHPETAPKDTGPSVLETARTYLETLYRFDWEAVSPLLSDDAVFEDPTSTYFGTEAWRLEGREAILDFFKSSSSGIAETSFKVLRSFSTSEHAIFEVVYKTQGDGAALGYPGLQMKIKVPGTTILQVRNGKVIHHLDHIDYESLMEQVEEQAGESSAGE